VEEEVERARARTVIFAKTAKIANIVKSAKNLKIRRVSEKLSNRRLVFTKTDEKLQILKAV